MAMNNKAIIKETIREYDEYGRIIKETIKEYGDPVFPNYSTSPYSPWPSCPSTTPGAPWIRPNEVTCSYVNLIF
jgi:hypothetical protein